MPVEGVEGRGPFIQIRLSGDALDRVVWGSEEMEWLFLFVWALKTQPNHWTTLWIIIVFLFGAPNRFPGVARVYSPPCPWDTHYQSFAFLFFCLLNPNS